MTCLHPPPLSSNLALLLIRASSLAFSPSVHCLVNSPRQKLLATSVSSSNYDMGFLPHDRLSLILTLGLYLCFVICIECAYNGYPQGHRDYDRVLNLPGQPSQPLLSHFSGYITVNQDHGRALFYWFFEAQTNPSNKPLLLWLNGGPGCSSIGYGAAVELGPLTIKRNGVGLQFNKYAWNKEANLLFLESPSGVGFSYTNISSDLSKLDDHFVAEDAYEFLVRWLKRFPQYHTHDFYIAGESYAGHYVPQLAELVYESNNYRKDVINLKGFIVGNPETDDYYDSKGIGEYAWSHAVISDQLYRQVNQVCNFKLPNWPPECSHAMSSVFGQLQEIDIYNIYAPSCPLKKTISPTYPKNAKSSLRKIVTTPGGYDPCYKAYVEEYFNRADVQKALHANVTGHTTGRWKVCNDPILRAYNFTVFSIIPIYTKLIKAGLRIWIYSGDADGRVPVIGSRYCIEALGLPLTTPWRSWHHNQQVAGRVMKYQGLTFATIRGAGHLVPLDKPSEALVLINSFLSGQDLPR